MMKVGGIDYAFRIAGWRFAGWEVVRVPPVFGLPHSHMRTPRAQGRVDREWNSAFHGMENDRSAGHCHFPHGHLRLIEKRRREMLPAFMRSGRALTLVT